MWTCFAGDRGFEDDDFQGMDMGKWDTAYDDMESETKLYGLHPALVAQRVRGKRTLAK